MKATQPFLITPWQSDFLESVLQQALHDTDGDISHAAFIFPHSRPEKYLERLLRHDDRVQRPLILPQCHTVSGLFALLRRHILARPAWTAGPLDRVGLLLACVREETGNSDILTRDDAEPFLADARHFFPWGVRLASLFEECFTQHRKPENFQHMDGQVSRFAELLLARLAHIFARYVEGLEEREWTTPGYDASLVADYLAEHGSLPGGIFDGKCVSIAGFHALTGTENALFHHLWKEHDAQIMLHADPALVHGTPHWSCEVFAEWAANWHAHLEFTPGYEFTTDGTEHASAENAGIGKTGAGKGNALFGKPSQTFRFYEGFDLHSQLTVLEKELADVPVTPLTDDEAPLPEVYPEGHEDAPLLRHAADTAVVLPDSGLLMPTLHHLPRTDINISMGYPLSRSPLFRLLDTIIRLQEGRRGNGYYWRDLVELLRHPYMKMLRPEEGTPDSSSPASSSASTSARAAKGASASPSVTGQAGESDTAAFRRELHRLEQTLREYGRKYPEPRDLIEQTYMLLGPDEMPPRPVLLLLDTLLAVTLEGFENPATPRDLGRALEGLCSLLLTRGSHLWGRFLIDAECLYRLMQSLIPELCHSQLAEEVFPPATLFAMLRQLMEAERVPFEATPLVGLQVMGVLETRLLTFRRVVIVDATEDRLPGSPAGDPLLPEALRPELGLPALHSREQVAAYHFFRLIAGAEEVVILWQEGADSPGIQERKKKKTRFVEELLWQEEKRLGRLLASKGQDGPLQVLASSLSPMPKTRRGIAVTPAIRKLVQDLLQRPVSASLLDVYLRCPVQFFHERVARLTPASEVTEGDDPIAVGDLFHTALQDFYVPYLGASLPGGPPLAESMQEELLEILHGCPEFTELSRRLPADSFAMLGCAGKERLTRYLANQPPTTVIALETALTAPFTKGNYSITLTGKADRIDLRPLEPPQEDEPESPRAAKQILPHAPLPASGYGIVILDYKTGRLPEAGSALWDNAGLWQRMALWQPRPASCGPDHAGDPLLAELARHLESVQLPFYLLLFSQAQKHGLLPEALHAVNRMPATDAIWVALGNNGEEKSLFPSKFSPEKRADIVETRMPELINFLLRHMVESSQYLPQPGKHCDWCSCAKMCMVGGA